MAWRVHPEGRPWALGGALTAAALALLGRRRAAQGAALAALGAAFFFRDPERHPPPNPAAVVSPADGVVMTVRRVEEPTWLCGPAWRIGVFMSVFDVHINRAPVSAQVVAVEHRPGRFLPAQREETLSENERRLYYLERADGGRVLVVQIAGLLARRTVPFVRPGMHVTRGERFGLIRFGSRVEVFLPAAAVPLVAQGHRVRAGETPLAYWE